MSLPPHSVAYMSVDSPKDKESFHEFFQSWIAQQDRHLQELLSASAAQSSLPRQEKENALHVLINAVIQHYEIYYKVKSKWSDKDVFGMLSPSWTSSLEDAFLWIGGWRPSMAFHLLYSKSGLQMESKLDQIIQRVVQESSEPTDLGDLTPSQLLAIDELQRTTIAEERRITEKMAEHQETVADTSMVELSCTLTELVNGGECGDGDERVDSSLASVEEGLFVLLEIADDLRLKTLKAVISLLEPIQTVHFLIAAAELHLRIHEWGHKRDAAAAAANANHYKSRCVGKGC